MCRRDFWYATHDTLIIEACISLVSTLSSSTTNVVFIYVFIRFPIFLRHVKAEDAAPDISLHFASSIYLDCLSIPRRSAATCPHSGRYSRSTYGQP
ncbi:hypothetical protein BJY52DRAFT_1302006 [Lactarius psammicola]|nr:hypothetical protein BJY52DRAFT_1302006 [Lactarius psammicola]